MAIKSFEIPLQHLRDTHGKLHPWYMSGAASMDDRGHVETSTRLESHVALSGFTGGMIATFLDAEKKVLYTTPPQQYGVDGFMAPSQVGATPSPRIEHKEFDASPDVFARTDAIAVSVFHDPKNRTAAVLRAAGKMLPFVVEWILGRLGAPPGTIATRTSETLAPAPTTRRRAATRRGSVVRAAER